jgi:hypothetical protein
MKHCVMCGMMRLCSATDPSQRQPCTGGGGGKGQDAVVPGGDVGDDEAVHIIPRQNKGVCTRCDNTVWVVSDVTADDAAAGGAGRGRGGLLEIKWCKGCKNFRPWAAFGEKVMATKCVRCRDRQKEKYAEQKRHHRHRHRAGRRSPLGDGDDNDDDDDDGVGEEKRDDDMIAAHGLRNLMNAS